MLVLLIGFGIALADQFTKYQICLRFFPGESQPIVPDWFNLVHVRNTGAAWGMLGDKNVWLAAFSVIVLVVLTVFRRAFLSSSTLHRVILGLITGGIVGNLFDRLRFGYVVDFLDFCWRSHHFPAFNIADAAICTGAGLYVLSSMLYRSAPLDGAPAA